MNLPGIFQSLKIFLFLFLLAPVSTMAGQDSSSIVNAPLRFASDVEQVISACGGSSLWTAESGWTESGFALLNILSSAEKDGLNPSDYHTELFAPFRSNGFELTLEKNQFFENRSALERLMTDAYLGFGIDLSGGRIDQALLPEKWIKTDRQEENLERLKQVLIQSRIQGLPDLGLSAFRPKNPEYAVLQEALQQMLNRKGKSRWQTFPSGPVLRPGMTDLRIPNLRFRLVSSGDHLVQVFRLPGADSWLESVYYDDNLVDSVKAFQRRHALVADGIIGARTMAALNISDGKQILQMELNLERMRWLPGDLGATHILVNIPDYKLVLKQDENVLLSSKAIVGRPDRPTPILSAVVSSLVVNPFWNVPQKLARRDLLPRIISDPAFLKDGDFTVYENWSPQAREIDPDDPDWSSIKPWDLAFKFRQKPGPRNPLGEIKFMFENPYSVFIHDTNHKERFTSQYRAFSSGCIRIENYRALAAFMLEEDEQTEPQLSGLTSLLKSKEHKRLSLPRQIPVHLLYLTCWVDESGKVQYRKDVYGYDSLLAEALEQPASKLDKSLAVAGEKNEEKSSAYF